MPAGAAPRIDIPATPDPEKNGSAQPDAAATPEIEIDEDEQEKRIKKSASVRTKNNVVELRKKNEQWQARLEELREEKELQGQLSDRDEAELQKLEAHVGHFAAIERQHQSAVELEQARAELKKLEEQEAEDRRVLTELRAKRIAEAEALERATEEIAKKEQDYQAAKDAAVVAAVTPDHPPLVIDPETIQNEIGKLQTEIGDHRVQLATYQAGYRKVERQLKTRLVTKAELLERIHIKPAHVLAAAAEAGAIAEVLSLKSKQHEEIINKEEEQRQLEIEQELKAKELIEEAEAKIRKHEETRFDAKRALKKAAPTLGKAAVIGGAGAAFGFFGGFNMLGKFFKTWIMRAKQPHRFIDDLFKKWSSETAEPPKGKGALVGGISAAFWTLMGDAPIAPHDVSMVKDRY